MARQDLAYQIAVNDAELRLATQHVAAFNAELELSTVAGAKLSTSLRATGRQAAQVGNFFTRNLTVPLVLAGAAAAKSAGQFDQAVGKIQGLTGATVAQTAQLRAAALSLSSKELTQGPTALANALFFLKSVGLSTKQSIAALKPISEAASGGLGDIAHVAEAVTSAMDAYGFANLSAAQATAILIQTVTKGKIPPEQLAGAIGKVVPVANSMGISFDQVGASLASLTRQGLNAGLAATSLRQVFATLIKPSAQTNTALASIGTNAEAVAASMKKIGVLPTLLSLRKQLGSISLDSKTLVAAFNGNAKAIEKVKTAADGAGATFAKLFPNIRALTGALILTGPRNKANQAIFDSLKAQTNPATAAATNKRALESQAATPIGQLNTQLSELKANTQGIGDSFLKLGAKVVGFVNGVLSFIHNAGPNLRGLIKDFGIALIALGPGIALFGRMTQAASFGVKVFGDWQVRAQLAAQGVAGINIAEDKLLIQTRKATTVFEESMATMTAAAGRAAKAVTGIGDAQVAASLRGARTSQAAALALSGRGSKSTSVKGSVGAIPITGAAADLPAARLALIQKQAINSVAVATDAAAVAQANYDKALALALPNQITYSKTQLESATAALALARANANVLFPTDEKLVAMTLQLVAAQRELTIAQQNGAGESIALAKVTSLQTDIARRQRSLSSNPNIIGPVGGGFAKMDSKAQSLAATSASTAIVTQGRIARTGWSTAVEGMKSASKLGFDFIALTFGIDVVQKIVGNSSQAKTAVTHDLLDINKAGVGAFAAVAAAALALGPKIAGGFTALRGGAGLFETLGVAALGWRAKIGLVLISILGLQKAGVGLEQIFNGVSIVMLARFAAVRLGIIEAGAAFGPWGIAAAAAAVLIVAKANAISHALYGITGALGITGKQLSDFGVANFNTVANMVEELKSATSESQKRAIVEKVIASSNADSADKAKFAAQFLGQAVADQLAGADILKKTLETTITGFDKLPPKIKSLVTLLQQTGKPLAAQALASGEQAKEQASQIAAAAALLRDLGATGPAAMLQAAVTSTKLAQTTLTNVFKDVQTQITTAFDNHTARMLDSFDEQTQSILDSFDKQTSKLEDALKVKVKVPSLNETFTVSVNGKTPAERELAALDKLQQRQNFQRDILSANQQLSTARQLGDPVEVQQALQKVQDAENERKQFILSARATTERTAADAALKTGKSTLDDQRSQQRQGISDARASARRDLEAARAVQEQQIKNALNAQKKLLDNGKIGIGTFYTDILAIMKKNNVSVGQAGADGGAAYTKAFNFALGLLKKQVQTTLAAVAKASDTAAGTVKKNLSFLGSLTGDASNPLSIAHSLATLTPAAINADVNSKAGVPTRPAILDALVAKDALIGLTPPQRSKAIAELPQNGKLTFDQYYQYLQKLPSKARANLSSVLGQEGFFRAATGAIVPGAGNRDSVHALLTPGEVIFNKPQQRSLAGLLGIAGAGPRALFDFVNGNVSRFAGGGTVPPPPEDPNLRRLLELLAHNAQLRSSQFNAGQSGIPSSQTIAGRNTSGAGFVRNLVPTNISSLVNHTTKGLTRLQKISLEGTLAQAQAHPLVTGLLSATATGTKIGTTPHAIGAGSLSGSGIGDTFIVQGDLNIPLSSSGNPERDAESLLGTLRKKVKRAPRRRTGRPLRGTLGIA